MTDPTGLAVVISQLNNSLTETAFFAIVNELVPLIVVIIPIALGLMFLRKLLRGYSRGKLSF